MIIFAVILCVSSVLLIKSVFLDRNINDTDNSQVIISEKYRDVEIMPEARGKITESQVDSIIKDYGTGGVKIIAVETENDRKKSKYWILGITWMIAFHGTVICCRKRMKKLV